MKRFLYVPALTLVLSMVLPSIAGAAPIPITLLFNDLSDSIDVRGIFFGSCDLFPNAEQCFGIVDSPDLSVVFADLSFKINILEPGGAISDTFSAFGGFTNAAFDFTSDRNNVPLPGLFCDAFSTCKTITETGGIQTLATIPELDASGATVALLTFQFESDISDVPEPSAFPLVLVGLVALIAARRRVRKSPAVWAVK